MWAHFILALFEITIIVLVVLIYLQVTPPTNGCNGLFPGSRNGRCNGGGNGGGAIVPERDRLFCSEHVCADVGSRDVAVAGAGVPFQVAPLRADGSFELAGGLQGGVDVENGDVWLQAGDTRTVLLRTDRTPRAVLRALGES